MISTVEKIMKDYPAEKAYLVHYKTPVSQGMADIMHVKYKDAGKSEYAYTGFNNGDDRNSMQFQGIDKSDVVFCICGDAQATEVQANATANGFTGQFVIVPHDFK